MSRLDQLQRLAALQPDDPLTHYGVGLELMQLERWDEALAAFGRALALDAEYVPAHQQAAQAHIRLGDFAAARESLAAGIALAEARRDSHLAKNLRERLELLP